MKPQFVLPFEKPIVDLEEKLSNLESQPHATPAALDSIRNVRVEIAKLKRETYENLDAWQTVQVARHQERPQAWDYIMDSHGVAAVVNSSIGYAIQETSKWEARALLICTLTAILEKGNAI